MKSYFIIILIFSFVCFSKSLPHFIFDGLESFHENLGETDKISFTIYGALSEEINSEKMYIKDYMLEDMGEFHCSLLNNENTENDKRTHKIVCSIFGSFERNGYILEEPIVYGFDFNDEKGKTTWPEQAEKKSFLIGEIGEKIELDGEPILLGNAVPYTNPLNSVRKDIVDKALKSLPSRSSVSKENMINAMKKAKSSYSLSEAESAFFVFKWVSQNIAYDCYNINNDMSKIDYSEDGTYTKGYGVCAGFSKVFSALYNGIGLEAHVIHGYTKRSIVQEKMPSKTNHVWNSLKIDSKYYLIDVQWGSGDCSGVEWVPKFNDIYFCTNPEIFIRSHLPEDQKWQLISPTMTLAEFVKMAKVQITFFTYGFKTISPDTASINAKEKFTVTLTYDTSIERRFIMRLSYLESSNKYVEQKNACFIDQQKTSATMTCYVNNKGTYKFKVFCGPPGMNGYPALFEYDIYSDKSSVKQMGFPTPHSLFYKSDMQIIEPYYNPLTRGRMLKFKIKTTTFDNLHIINKAKNGNTHFRELDNNGKGEFTGDDVYIFGEEVYISTQMGNFQYIVKYTTIRDSTSVIDASFPSSSHPPKNTLYSPLLDTLQVGKTYNFKIKCESGKKMAVLEGSNNTYLSKDGSVFSGRVKINGIGNQVKIVDYDGNSCKTFYTYKTSR